VKPKEYALGSTLPMLNMSAERPATKERYSPNKTAKASLSGRDRLIKTSHLGKRIRANHGEVNEGGKQQLVCPYAETIDNSSSFFSPPPIDRGVFISVATPQRIKSRQ